MKESESLSWSAPEYHAKKHSIDWYWSVGLVTLIVVVLAIYFKNYLFAFLIFLGVATLVYLSVRGPETVTIVITNKGIRVRSEFYTYRALKAYWVEEEPQPNGDRHLLLLTSRLYLPMLALPLGDVAPETIRRAIAEHLKEEEMHENPSHNFLDILGF